MSKKCVDVVRRSAGSKPAVSRASSVQAAPLTLVTPLLPTTARKSEALAQVSVSSCLRAKPEEIGRFRKSTPIHQSPFPLPTPHTATEHSLMRLAFILCMLLLAVPSPAAAALEQWVYVARNLWVDKNVDDLETLLKRAAAAGYTHVLLADSKFGKLGDMDARYFKNIERVKKLAADLKLQIVPAVFPVGYSNDILWHDPNLIEALPVRDALFTVKGGVATVQAVPPVVLKGGDFSDIAKWDWKDAQVQPDNGTA